MSRKPPALDVGLGIHLLVAVVVALTLAGSVIQGVRCGWLSTDTACLDPDATASVPVPPALGTPALAVATGFLIWDAWRSWRGKGG